MGSAAGHEVNLMIETPVAQVETGPAGTPRGRYPLCGWRAVAALGAGLILVAITAIHVLVRQPIPPLLAFAALLAVSILLLWRGPVRLGAVIGGLVGLAMLLPDLQGVITGLTLVRDPFEFTLNATALTGALLLIIGGGVVAVRGRAAARSRATTALLVIGAAVLPLALALSTTLRLTMGEAVAQEGDVSVSIADFAFPERLAAGAGTVAFHITNEDPVAHTFTIPELGISANVPGGATVRVTGEAGAGQYAYVCRVSGHEFMGGELVVEG
jgi:plastocyanin